MLFIHYIFEPQTYFATGKTKLRRLNKMLRFAKQNADPDIITLIAIVLHFKVSFKYRRYFYVLQIVYVRHFVSEINLQLLFHEVYLLKVLQLLRLRKPLCLRIENKSRNLLRQLRRELRTFLAASFKTVTGF